MLQSYTFLYVPCNTLAILANCAAKLYVPIRSVQPSRDSCELCCKVIRSYTFRCNSLVILTNYITKLYVPIRSAQPLSQFSQIVSQSYTFLYVPKNFRHVPAGNLEDAIRKLYVPIRSAPVPTRSVATVLIMCLEVIRSYTFRRNCVHNSPRTSKRTISLSRVTRTRPYIYIYIQAGP